MPGIFPKSIKNRSGAAANKQSQNHQFIPNSFNKIEIDDIEFFECCGSAEMKKKPQNHQIYLTSSVIFIPILVFRIPIDKILKPTAPMSS